MPQLSNGAALSLFRTAFNQNGLPRNNFTAVRAPVASDNAAQGYEVGSRWINIANNEKWTLTLISGATATWTPDAAVASGGGSGLTFVTTDASLTGAGTEESPLALLRPVPPGTSGQVVGYGSSGALIAMTPPSGGSGEPDAGAIENFGGVMSVFPVLTPPSQAVMEANRTALIAALAWSASTGGVVQLGYGILYIWGAVELPIGASINGKGMDASRIQQGRLPQSASEAWLDVLTCTAVSGTTGGNGYNNITNLSVDGGWNRRSYIGDPADVWTYPANRMTAAGLRVATPTGGPTSAAAFREKGTDAHVRVQNVLFQNIAGHGYHMTGRGENFAVMIEIRLCANGFYLNSPDCFATLHTVYTIGDTGGEITAGGGNFRFSDSKLWFCGMQRGSEPVGAGLILSSPGGQGYGIRNVDTQDTWGPGVVIAGDSNILFEGFIDEAGGGRLEEQGFGWQSPRTLPRCYVRLNGTSRRARLAVQIRGGARNGVGNYPFLAHLAGSAMEFNRIQFEGPLSGINMTTGTITGASYANGIVLANGLTNGSSPRYNEIRHGFRLLHGAMTAADLANAAHPVNDALYGPGEVTMTSGVKASRRIAGLIGWNIHRAPYLVTEEDFDLMSSAEQLADDRVYIVYTPEA